MFGSFKNPFATITSLSELYFRFRFILLVQTKKVIPMKICKILQNFTSKVIIILLPVQTIFVTMYHVFLFYS